MASLDLLLDSFCRRHALPPLFRETVKRHYLTLLPPLLAQQQQLQRPLLVGLHGCQGSGKSTLAALWVDLLQQAYDCPAATLSLDDFYLSHAARQQLAVTVHPLLQTRGVPGTHDLALLTTTLQRLANGDSLALPRFNKASDDPLPRSQWPLVSGVKIVIFEGWCVATPPQDAAALATPVNALEAEADPKAVWRHYVNLQLAAYQPLFHRLDRLFMLQAPNFATVFRWRQQQEERLRAQLQTPQSQRGLMSDVELQRFIQHFQRLTEHSLATVAALADRCWRLDAGRTPQLR
ncbi:MAG: hypothetical protein HQL49_12710 [Gammaproteobacteria bacterium]|nr:hypothetical protein [Gammaproteobacteria bacterium]